MMANASRNTEDIRLIKQELEFVKSSFGEHLQRIEKKVDDLSRQLGHMEEKVDNRYASKDALTYVTERLRERDDDLDKRVESIENNNKWLVMMVLGSVIMAILSTVIK